MEEVLKYDIDNNSIDKLKEYGFKEDFCTICNQRYYYIYFPYNKYSTFQIFEDGAIVVDVEYIRGLTGKTFEMPCVLLDLFNDGLIIKSEPNI